MFNRASTPRTQGTASGPVTTVLGEGTRWEGEVQAGAEGLRIEGEVEGSILSQGQVIVAATGIVRGTIHARHLTVCGRIEGVFKVEGCLEILSTGWVEGDVELGLLVVDEGGTLQGTCHRRTPVKAREGQGQALRKEDAPPEHPVHPAAGVPGPHPDRPLPERPLPERPAPGGLLGRNRF